MRLGMRGDEVESMLSLSGSESGPGVVAQRTKSVLAERERTEDPSRQGVSSVGERRSVPTHSGWWCSSRFCGTNQLRSGSSLQTRRARLARWFKGDDDERRSLGRGLQRLVLATLASCHVESQAL
jgi:hypothetical protein